MRRRHILSGACVLAMAFILSGGTGAQTPAPPAEPRPAATWGTGPNSLRIATGSPGELGLLEAIAADFARRNDASVIWFRAGSGQAMNLLKERKVDMVLAHAPPAERRAVADGWATGRQLIGSNEFWIVGPENDPARIADAKDAVEAFRRIEAARAKKVTRADNSGTHQKEMEIWKLAGIDPRGDWLIPTRDFMTASLRRANTEGAYFLTDSSTFVAERKDLPGLKVLFKGGQVLMNPYHTLWLKDPTPGTPMAERFLTHLMSEDIQKLLRVYGKDRYGEAMYNDARVSRERWPIDQ
jgi:tungstate transport system substrate-binding protein